MKRSVKVLLSTLAIGAISLFGVFGASCGAVDWVEEKFDQLTCEHATTKVEAAKAPTCTEDGWMEYEVCVDCGWEVTKKVVDEAKGHTIVVLEGYDATCTTMGKTDGSFCTVCEEVITEQKFTPALGHHKAELKAVAPTCTETGLTSGIACDNEGCGQIFVAQKVVETVDHNYYKGICRVCSAFEEEFDTSAMTEVEVKVGDSFTGGVYRLYSEDSSNDVFELELDNGDFVFNLAYTAGFAVYYDGVNEINIPSTSVIKVLDVDFADSGYSLELYVPANIREEWEGGTFYVDSNTVVKSLNNCKLFKLE